MLDATDQAQQWAFQTWEQKQAYFNELAYGETFSFSIFDLLSFAKLKTLDWQEVWENISGATSADSPNRQALASVLESIAVTGYNMGLLLFILTVFMGALTVRKWQSGRMKMFYQPSNR